MMAKSERQQENQMKVVLRRRFENEPFGIVPDDNLEVTRVQAGSLAEGKLELGDIITHANGLKICTPDQLFIVLKMADEMIKLTVIRDPVKAASFKEHLLPPEREKHLSRRAGFVYLLANLEWQPGSKRLGLVIKHRQNRVIVSRVDKDTISANYLRFGDRIYDVNGKRVSDKDVTKDMIIQSLQDSGAVELLIERPESENAWKLVEASLEARDNQPPSQEMPSDVQQIAKEQRQRMRQQTSSRASVPILVRPTHQTRMGSARSPSTARVQIKPRAELVHIRSDCAPGKQLRKVRPRN